MAEEYPICVFKKIYRKDIGELHDTINELGNAEKFSELIDLLQKNKDMVNSCKLPVNEENKQPSLFTPLHYAALKASKNEIEQLVKMGASRCLKTAKGETAYDIAVREGRPTEILEILDIPEEIKLKANQIDKMEKGLHSVIKGRVEDLIKKNGQELPQLAFLFENNGYYYYPVPGMYGGFSVSVQENGIQADSWERICDRSEMNHFIDWEGNVTLLPNDNPL